MLVLTRKLGEKILIGDDIVITVLDVRGDSIRIGVDAPRGVRIQRDEVVRAVAAANVAASHLDDSAEERIKASLGTLVLTPRLAAAETDAASDVGGPAGVVAPTITPTAAVTVAHAADAVATRPRPGPTASAQMTASAQTSTE